MKKNEKKERKGAVELEWTTAHFFLSLSHNTASCILTQGLTGKGAQWHATTRRGRVRTRLCDMASKGHDTTGPRTRGMRQRERAWPGWWGSRDTNIVSCLGAALCRDTARDTAAIRRPTPCDTGGRVRNTERDRDLCRDTILYRDRGRSREAVTRRANALVRTTIRQGRPATRPRGRPRYGRGRPATRRLVRHDTVGPACSLGHGCVHTVHLTQF